MINCTFLYNIAIFDNAIVKLFLSKLTAVPDIVQLNPEFGGVLYFQGQNLLINRSVFIGNTGYKGGAIYITSNYFESQQNVVLTESYFKANRGNLGGVINFPMTLNSINALISFCIFIANIARSYKIKFKIKFIVFDKRRRSHFNRIQRSFMFCRDSKLLRF